VPTYCAQWEVARAQDEWFLAECRRWSRLPDDAEIGDVFAADVVDVAETASMTLYSWICTEWELRSGYGQDETVSGPTTPDGTEDEASESHLWCTQTTGAEDFLGR